MAQGEALQTFQTTSWSLIVSARASPADLDSLMRQYWAPVYAYIRRTGKTPDDAADLTQDFLSSVVMGRQLLEKADPKRGRFRTFLQAALRNHLIDRHRASRALAREIKTSFLPDDEGARAIAEPSESDDPNVAFNRQWAARVLAMALERLETHCRRDGLEPHWRAFDANVIQPTLSAVSPRPLAELASAVGATGPEQVSSMLHTVRRKFRLTLREVVSETVDVGVNVDDEIAELKKFLGIG
jgi:RNA polymerase sigma factor (sigma-70 family)